MRIALLTPADDVICFLDSEAPKAMQLFEDNLHTYRYGLAYTYEFKALADHPNSKYLKEGNKLSFTYDGVDYYMTIIQVVRSSREISVTAQGLTLELLNEEVDAVESPSVKTAEQYIDDLHFESSVMRIGLNEVKTETRRLKFESRETIISRLYSIADAFGAEAEFKVKLNDNHSLNYIELNLKKAGTLQGVGQDRTNQGVIRYGTNVQGIEKESDISEIFTGIRARGKKSKVRTKVTRKVTVYNGMDVKVVTTTVVTEQGKTETRVNTIVRDYQKKLPDFAKTEVKTDFEEQSENGNKKTSSTSKTVTNGRKEPKLPEGAREGPEQLVRDDPETERIMTLEGFGIPDFEDENGVYILDSGGDIRARDARDRFPSSLEMGSDQKTFKDGYIFKYYEDTSCEDQAALYEGALKELRSGCMPKVKYTIKGYVPGVNVGDWLTIEDAQYDPPMYIQCRVMEQEKSMLKPYEGTTTVDNFTEFSSRIDQSLQSAVHTIFDQTRLYEVSIAASEGTIFKDDIGSSLFRAVVLKDGIDVTQEMRTVWMLDGAEQTSTDGTLLVYASGFEKPSVRLTVSVYEKASNRFRGSAEITLQKISLPAISQEAKEDGSLVIKTESAGISTSNVLQKGKDGFSPTVSLTKSGTISRLVITDQSGEHSTLIRDGAGTDGFSPLIDAVKSGKTTTLSITDARGTSSVQILDGSDGTAGRGISSIVVTYAHNSSYSSAPADSNFSTSYPSISASYPYIWKREVITYTDGTTQTVKSLCAARGTNGTNGSNGTQGPAGADAPTITGITGYYYRSSSTSTPSDSSFSTTMPTLTSTYKYLWMYEQYTFSDGTTKNGPKHIAGVHGNTGSTGPQGTPGADAVIDESAIKTVVLDAFFPVGSIVITYNSTNPQSKMGGTWTRIAQGRVLVGQGTSTADANGDTRTFSGQTTGGVNYPLLTPNAEAKGYGLSSSNPGYANRPLLARTDSQTKPDLLPPYQVVYYWRRTT